MASMDTKSVAVLAKEIFDRLNDHDLEGLLPFAGDGLVEEWPVVGRLEGTAAVANHFAAIFASLPDLKIEIEKTAEDGESVFVHWHMRGTFTGAPFYGLSATGRVIDLRGTDYFTFRDGKVISNFIAYDGFAFAVQAGVLPAPGSPLNRALTAVTNVRTRLTRTLRR